ncbi:MULTISPECIES: hypothetical protein [Methylococcus]|uniref:Transposase n=1 Tax=Methylococcus capsulatus TaxID=414 RepID=A0ABZ2F5E8_METCP|nr:MULTISPECIES: hypothetical protein [Methylococcus]MDF9390982.1 hypothetical protein [Methylococcus capsulatus]
MPEAIVVGIDIAKQTFDAAFGVTGRIGTFANDDAGHDAFVAKLFGMTVDLIVMEATGGLERDLACMLQATGSRDCPCRRLVVILAQRMGITGTPTGDFHPISSCPCRAYTGIEPPFFFRRGDVPAKRSSMRHTTEIPRLEHEAKPGHEKIARAMDGKDRTIGQGLAGPDRLRPA